MDLKEYMEDLVLEVEKRKAKKFYMLHRLSTSAL